MRYSPFCTTFENFENYKTPIFIEHLNSTYSHHSSAQQPMFPVIIALNSAATDNGLENH